MIYRFQDRDGETSVNGKPHWPDILTLRLKSRKDALDAAKWLISQAMDDDRDVFELTYCGKLEERGE